MLIINADAAYKPQNKLCGIGLNIQIDKEQITYKYRIENVFDNHFAEFIALSLTLDILRREGLNKQLIQYLTDSKIVVDSLEKEYVKHREYQTILLKIQNKIIDFPMFFPKWVPEKENLIADRYAKQALSNKGHVINYDYFSDQN